MEASEVNIEEQQPEEPIRRAPPPSPPVTAATPLHPASSRPSSLTAIISGANDIDIAIDIVSGGMEEPAPPVHQPTRPSDSVTTPVGTESPGTSQMSPPPSYHDIPGTVPQGSHRGPPPSYEDAVDPNAEPPSYDSLFGRIRDTHKSSRNLIDFLAKLILLLIGTIGCTIACGLTIMVPVCMIIIGAIHLHDCPVEPCIPIFLIVGGSFSVLKYILNVATTASRRRSTDSNEPPPAHPGQYLINCFLCAWFITGCVWVYRIYPPRLIETASDDPEYPSYCNKLVYNFAFWLITSAYIFLGLFTSCICCFSIVVVMLKGEN